MVEHRELKDKKLEDVFQKHARKPYIKPEIVKYGHMEKLTEGGASGVGDVATRLPVP